MNKSVKTICIVIIFSLLIAWAVYYQGLTQNVSNNPSRQCDLSNTDICNFSVGSQQVIVKFAQNVQVEQQNEVTITLPNDIRVAGAWVQGINMYMGKTLLIELGYSNLGEETQQQMAFFLGACSEAHMRWQLVLNIKKANHEQVESFFINFKTELT